MPKHDKHHHPASGSPAELAICPVMHVAVNKVRAEARGLVRTYQGKKYYLCCNTCLEALDKDPKKYADGDKGGGHQHKGS